MLFRLLQYIDILISHMIIPILMQNPWSTLGLVELPGNLNLKDKLYVSHCGANLPGVGTSASSFSSFPVSRQLFSPGQIGVLTKQNKGRNGTNHGLFRNLKTLRQLKTFLTVAVSESFRKFQKVSESFRKFWKVLESFRNFRKVSDISGEFWKVSESF